MAARQGEVELRRTLCREAGVTQALAERPKKPYCTERGKKHKPGKDGLCTICGSGKHPHRKDYSVEEIEKGLLAVAYWNGNTRKAAAMLQESDPPLQINHATLYYWVRNNHAQTYERIRQELAPKVQARAAEEHSALAAKQIAVSGEMTERLSRKSHHIPARDLPGAIRNLSTAAAIHEDKTDLLRGEPGRREAQKSATELLRGLAIKLGKDPKQIEGTAEEEPQAQVDSAHG